MFDARFGPLIPPQPPYQPPGDPRRRRPVEDWERDFVPDSLSKLDSVSAESLKQAMREISSGWKIGKVLTFDTIIIWVVDKAGDIWFALEELVLRDGMPTGRPKHQKLELTAILPKLGHPALINGAWARISGEIYFETKFAAPFWKITNSSGRYGRHPSRVPAHLDNVADQFRIYGIILTPFFESL